jgi:hypothetical protein
MAKRKGDVYIERREAQKDYAVRKELSDRASATAETQKKRLK